MSTSTALSASSALSVGFDYGTSQCAMGVMEGVAQDRVTQDQVKLIPLTATGPLVASTLFTWDRSLIYRYVAEQIHDSDVRQDYATQFSTFLNRSRQVLTEQGMDDDALVLFGQEAFDQYAKDPSEGHYLRSPKSFLGSTGLNAQQLLFIEQVVTAMMMRFKSIAETHCDAAIENVVIGRPINFQGLRGEESNRQAITVLRQASRRAGFKHVEFLYEPLAAGIDFESRLERDRTVLVVDVGGGTTDCSMIRMGPSRRCRTQREADFLAHCGQRVGGNDFDIHLSFHRLMPLLGSQSAMRSGKPMPTQPFWRAVETNNAGSQLEFYSEQYVQLLHTLLRDSDEPALLRRLITLRDTKANFQLVAAAEHAKVCLSDREASDVDLSFLEPGLSQPLFQHELPAVFAACLGIIAQLIDETIAQAGCIPDGVYITGGMGQSPLLRTVIRQRLGDIEILSGDYFGSVAAGLTKWADEVF